MSIVRFAKVVETCGKPEIFLLLSKDDPDFQKALKAKRVMSLLGSSEGKTDFGQVGYDEKKRPQLLVFPKSLKRFEGDRVVGIKYEAFTEERAERPVKQKKAAKRPQGAATKKPKAVKAPKKVTTPKAKVSPPQKVRPAKKEAKKLEPAKVIPFPSPKKQEPERDEEISDLEKSVRQAMGLLEKGNSVAAYNVLKNAMGD